MPNEQKPTADKEKSAERKPDSTGHSDPSGKCNCGEEKSKEKSAGGHWSAKDTMNFHENLSKAAASGYGGPNPFGPMGMGMPGMFGQQLAFLPDSVKIVQMNDAVKQAAFKLGRIEIQLKQMIHESSLPKELKDTVLPHNILVDIERIKAILGIVDDSES